MVTLVKPLQPMNALSPIEVTELGIIVFLHPLINVFVAVSIMALQFSRESYTELPQSTIKLHKPLQPPNALSPIEVTELGMVTLVKPLQYWNAYLPIEVTDLGMIVFLHPLINVFVAVLIMALQFSRESYTELPLSTFMLVKPLQASNDPLPIEVTELGMVTLVKPLQSENA